MHSRTYVLGFAVRDRGLWRVLLVALLTIMPWVVARVFGVPLEVRVWLFYGGVGALFLEMWLLQTRVTVMQTALVVRPFGLLSRARIVPLDGLIGATEVARRAEAVVLLRRGRGKVTVLGPFDNGCLERRARRDLVREIRSRRRAV